MYEAGKDDSHRWTPMQYVAVLAPCITLIVGMVTIYFTFRNQQRLKAFEFLLQRRDLLLKDVEAKIEQYALITRTLQNYQPSQDDIKILSRFHMLEWREALGLFHRMDTIDYEVENLSKAYYGINNELVLGKQLKRDELLDHIDRKINILNIFYGMVHRNMSNDLRKLSTSPFERWSEKRARTRRALSEQLQLEKAAASSAESSLQPADSVPVPTTVKPKLPQ